MAIETRRVPLERTKIGPNPINTLAFTGATYADNPQLKDALKRKLGSSSEITLVRFTTPRPDRRGYDTTEFVGAVGQLVAGTLLKPEKAELDQGAESILARTFSNKTNDKTRIDVTFEDNKLKVPRDTEVEIETVINLGMQPETVVTTTPRIYRYEPVSVIVPPDNRITETWVKKVRQEYDAFIRGEEAPRTRVLTPKLAYETRESGGRASDEVSLEDFFAELSGHVDDLEAGELIRIRKAARRGEMVTVGDVRKKPLGEFHDIWAMGPRMAMFLKVAFAKFDESTKEPA